MLDSEKNNTKRQQENVSFDTRQTTKHQRRRKSAYVGCELRGNTLTTPSSCNVCMLMVQ